MARTQIVWDQNLIIRSEEFSDAAWTPSQASVTANAVANPRDGALTADAIVDNVANDIHYLISPTFTGPPLGAWLTMSIYARSAKAATPWFLISLGGAFSGGGTYFNLVTGARTDVLALGFSEIESLPNGWWRCSVAGPALQDQAPSEMNVVPTVAAGVYIYTGDGTPATYVWGAQATRSNGPVRYAPSTSTQVNPTAGLRLYAAGRSP